MRAYEQGALVLAGRAREELPVPFGPYLEALAHLVAHVDEGVLAEHVAEHGAELSRLVPELAARVGSLPPLPPSDQETERYRLYRAVAGLLSDTGLGPGHRAAARRSALGRPLHPPAHPVPGR